MRVQQHLLPTVLSAAAAVSAQNYSTPPLAPETFSDPAAACQQFQSQWSNQTFFPNTNSSMYEQLNEDFFTSQAWLGPACIFAPSSAEQMSYAVKSLKELNTPFAIRGGGHMPINDTSNIDSSGVLISSSGLSQLVLSEDKSTLEVGPGNRWAAVYKHLEPHQLTIVGGRMGVVGVPGFLLGGGISFFSNEFGWASANIAQFDCVLANGDIVSATADNDYADLFWALRGGGNSFALVTGFHLKTIPLPAVALGETAYSSEVTSEQFLDAVHDFAHGANDPKAAITPIVRAGHGAMTPSYHCMLFHRSDTTDAPSLANFTSVMPVNSTTFKVRPSFYNWTLDSDRGFEQVHGMRNRFYVLSLHVNREAMQIIHDMWFDALARDLSDVANLIMGVAFMPMVPSYFAASMTDGGDPMGVDPSDGPYLWIEQSFMWSDPADDDRIAAFLETVNPQIKAAVDAAVGEDVWHKYLYLNDADYDQPVFEGYPKANVMMMQMVREKYDPERVFTDLMPGGWKVDRAFSGQAEA
ncbi:putative FAD binding domain-containing protein [Neofusicoccum parvum]|uniref:FAD binding domain-containing protein n=1 Tax=Neofusicoccum parvum TaxID=310453 RepID=A0ACB5SKH3_9PEZI|nr:putative FAD binding domain-containing protein [Neofusicoccum parvum]